jgi:Na+/melibiose symporter-like transporter
MRRVRHFSAAAHLAKSVVWSAVDLLLGWYLYAVLGLPAKQVVFLLFVFLMFGAVCDAFVGMMLAWLRASRTLTLRIHLAASAATSIALFAQFAPSRETADWILPIGLAFRLAFAAYDVPQGALTSLLPVDGSDARSYVELRSVLSAVGRLIVTAANLALSQLPQAMLRSGGALTLTVFALALVVTAGGLSFVAHPQIDRRLAIIPETSRRVSRIPAAPPELLIAFFVSTAFFALVSRLLIFAPAKATQQSVGAVPLLAFCAGTSSGQSDRSECWFVSVGADLLSSGSVSALWAPWHCCCSV